MSDTIRARGYDKLQEKSNAEGFYYFLCTITQLLLRKWDYQMKGHLYKLFTTRKETWHVNNLDKDPNDVGAQAVCNLSLQMLMLLKARLLSLKILVQLVTC